MNQEAQWFAVYTKFKAEKWVMDRLQAKGIEAYTPLISQVRRYSKKIATHYYPIISCYVFVKITPREKLAVLQTEHTFGFVKFRNKDIPIPDQEILMLKKITGEKVELEMIVGQQHIGREVQIVAGNLTGIKGKLIDILGKKEFVVELDAIGCQLKINIDPELLMTTDQLIAHI